MSVHCIQPLDQPLDAVVQLPGSKSICHRALVAAAFAQGHSILSNFLFCEDTDHFLSGLQELGIALQTDREDNRVEITGCAGHLPEVSASLHCGNSGTMLRFMTAIAATSVGTVRLDGSARIRQRPLAPILRTLRDLGALFEFHGQEDHAPLTVHGRGLRGGTTQVDGSMSSQFTSALMLCCPCSVRDTMLTVSGQPVSRPYVGLTARIMEAFGVSIICDRDDKIIIPAPQSYDSCNYRIEPDASTASYFLAAAAIVGGRVCIEGLGAQSHQGDLVFAEILADMGCQVTIADGAIEVYREPGLLHLKPIDLDLGDMPDVVPTLAVLAMFAADPSHLRNIKHLRYKESDRLQALARELKRLGAKVHELPESLQIYPPTHIEPCTLETGCDHRMAMALSLVGLAIDGIAIDQPECVAKSYPQYFQTLSSLNICQ